MGEFISILLIICIGFTFDNSIRQKKGIRYAFFSLPIIFIVFLAASNSRAAWIGTFTSLLYLIFVRYKHKLHTLPFWYKLGVASLFMVLISFLLFGLYKYKTDSADGRLLIWQVSAHMIKDKPLLGFGVDGFKTNYMNYQAAYFLTNPNSSFASLADNNQFAFNEFIKIWIEQGLPGLILFSLLIYHVIVSKIDSKKETQYQMPIIARTTLVGLLAFAFFSYPFLLLQFQVLFVFLIAVVSSYSSPIFQLQVVSKYTIPVILTFCLIAFNLHFYKKNMLPYSEAFIKWNKILKSFYDDEQGSITGLEHLYPKLRTDPDFLFSYGKALNTMKFYYASASILERSDSIYPSYETLIELGISYEQNGEYQKAKKCWIKASLMIPSRMKPEYLLAKMYYRTGDWDNARILTNKLINTKPKLYSPEVYSLIREIELLHSDINSLIKNNSINP